MTDDTQPPLFGGAGDELPPDPFPQADMGHRTARIYVASTLTRLRDDPPEHARMVESHLDTITQAIEGLHLDGGFLEDQAADPERQSEVLLALLRLAPTDELAARLLLQRFVPLLRSIAGWKQPLRQTDWSAMIVSAVYEVIATYPVERRPRRVAGNIVWDVRKRMYATLREHRRCMAELSAGEPQEDARIAPDIAGRQEAADLLRWAAKRCRVPRDVARLIVLTRVSGFEVEELTDRRAVPSARLRQRRWRCEQRMREALASC